MRSNVVARSVCGAVVSVAAACSMAAEFQPMGSMAVSMGGAGVACARGGFAAYYNPALLARSRHGGEFEGSLAVGYRDINAARSMSELADVDIEETFDALAENPVAGGTVAAEVRDDVRVISAELHRLSIENGLQVVPNGSLGMQIGPFGFGVYGLGEVAACAVVDADHLAFIVEDGGQYYAYDEVSGTYRASSSAEYQASSLEYALDNELTYVHLTGLLYAEIPIAYGHRFETGAGTFDVGASLKIMPGTTVDMRIAVDSDSDEASDDFNENKTDSTSWGVDVGALYAPPGLEDLSAGIVCKNLNGPAFDAPDGGTMEVDPQIRAGIAYDALGDRLTLALDLDLSSNEALIPGLESRYVGGGVDFHPCNWFSIRGGLMRNLAESDDGTIVTGGLGFGLKWFQLDVSGQYSTETTTVDDEEIPRYAKIQIGVVSRWF